MYMSDEAGVWDEVRLIIADLSGAGERGGPLPAVVRSGSRRTLHDVWVAGFRGGGYDLYSLLPAR